MAQRSHWTFLQLAIVIIGYTNSTQLKISLSARLSSSNVITAMWLQVNSKVYTNDGENESVKFMLTNSSISKDNMQLF